MSQISPARAAEAMKLQEYVEQTYVGAPLDRRTSGDITALFATRGFRVRVTDVGWGPSGWGRELNVEVLEDLSDA